MSKSLYNRAVLTRYRLQTTSTVGNCQALNSSNLLRLVPVGRISADFDDGARIASEDSLRLARVWLQSFLSHEMMTQAPSVSAFRIKRSGSMRKIAIQDSSLPFETAFRHGSSVSSKFVRLQHCIDLLLIVPSPKVITGLMLASTILAFPAKDARDGRLLFSSMTEAPAVKQRQLVYLLPTELAKESSDPRWMWGHIKKCRICPDNAKPVHQLSSFNPHAVRPFNWAMEASWIAWTRPWSSWGFLPIHLLPCCPKPVVTSTPAPTTTFPSTTFTPDPVTIEFIEITDTTTDPTDSQPTTYSPPTPEVQPTELPTTEKVQITELPTTERVQSTPVQTTEKVQATTLPAAVDVQSDEMTDNPIEPFTIPDAVDGKTNDVDIRNDEFFPVSIPTERQSAPPAIANSGVNLDDALILPLISAFTNKTATNNVQFYSAIDPMTDLTTAGVIMSEPVNSANHDGANESSKYTDSTEEDLLDGGLIPDVPLTKTVETSDDMTRLIDLGEMLTQLKQSGDGGDSLPPESVPLKGLRLLMNLYPPSSISFLRR